MADDYYPNHEVLSAPNRYRKLFRGMLPETVEASSGIALWAAQDHPDFDEAIASALEMQRADWPEKADRALGLEPHICLHDVILLWERPREATDE